MAKESMKAREVKRAKLVAKYAEKRKALKERTMSFVKGATKEPILPPTEAIPIPIFLQVHKKFSFKSDESHHMKT